MTFLALKRSGDPGIIATTAAFVCLQPFGDKGIASKVAFVLSQMRLGPSDSDRTEMMLVFSLVVQPYPASNSVPHPTTGIDKSYQVQATTPISITPFPRATVDITRNIVENKIRLQTSNGRA